MSYFWTPIAVIFLFFTFLVNFSLNFQSFTHQDVTHPPHLRLFLTAFFTLVVCVYDKLLGVGILIQCSSVTQSPAMTNWPSNSSIMQTSTNIIKLQQQDSPLMPSHIQQMAILDWNTLPNFIHISFQILWKNHLEMTMVGKSIFWRNHMF